MSTWSVCGMCLSANRWAKFMGYPDERSWARADRYQDIYHPQTDKAVRGKIRYVSGYEVNLDACSGTIGEQVD